jgi:hypothetical protein
LAAVPVPALISCRLITSVAIPRDSVDVNVMMSMANFFVRNYRQNRGSGRIDERIEKNLSAEIQRKSEDLCVQSIVNQPAIRNP